MEHVCLLFVCLVGWSCLLFHFHVYFRKKKEKNPIISSSLKELPILNDMFRVFCATLPMDESSSYTGTTNILYKMFWVAENRQGKFNARYFLSHFFFITIHCLKITSYFLMLFPFPVFEAIFYSWHKMLLFRVLTNTSLDFVCSLLFLMLQIPWTVLLWFSCLLQKLKIYADSDLFNFDSHNSMSLQDLHPFLVIFPLLYTSSVYGSTFN